MITLAPATLEGHGIRLEPLTSDHEKDLAEAVTDGRLWELWYTVVPPPDRVAKYITEALKGFEAGHMLPWAVRELTTGAIIGSTRYHDVDAPIDRVEIGYTWYAKSWQKTHVNTTCKLLLLTHAFEELGCLAVEFRTHWHNHQSRTAIARLGAKQDGVLRNHRRMPDGSLRDTVVFSILDSEWPAVRNGLRYRLDRAGS